MLIQQFMHNLYFSKNKATQSLSPSINILKKDPSASELSLDDRMDLIEQELNQLAMSHNHSMIQLNHIIDRSKDYLNVQKNKYQRIMNQKIDDLQYRLTTILETEKEKMLEKTVTMKRFIQANQRVMTEIIRTEIQQEKNIQRQIEKIIQKKLKEIRQSMESVAINRQENASKVQKGNRDLKAKLKKGIDALGSLLARHKQQKNQMKKQGSKLIRQYLRILEDIDEGKRDRQAKQEQLLVKIEQLSIGEMTKENTLSRIQ